MSPITKLRAFSFFVILSTWVGFVALAGCAQDPEAKLVSAVPDIDRAVAHRLTADDDSTLVRYARTAGIYPFRDAGSAVVARLHAESTGEFLDTRATLLSALDRIAIVYYRVFDSGFFAKESAFWADLSAGDAVRLGRMRTASVSLMLDTTLSTAAKIDSIRGFLPVYQSIGYLPGVVNCKHTLGTLLAESDKDAQLRYYREALADAQRAEMYPMMCQILGALGHEAIIAGHLDSMSYFWNRSRDLAELHKLPDYAARIYEFYALQYQKEGKLALAHDLLHEAQEVCSRLKGGYRELRFLARLIQFYNDLESWDVSGRLLQRADLLVKQVPENLSRNIHTPRLRIQLARARYEMGTGRLDHAEQILKEIKPLVRQQANRDSYPRLLHMWAKYALEYGRTAEARSLIEEGIARCREVNYPFLIPMFYSLQAQLEFEKGHHNRALAALASFEKSARLSRPAKYEHERVKNDAIHTRILLALGDTDSAVVELGLALGRLEQYVVEHDGSTHGYIWLEQCGELRDLLHDMTARDPAAAYGAEMYWRGLYQLLGGARSTNKRAGFDAASGRFGDNLMGVLHAQANDAQRRVEASNSVHCVYHIAGDRLCRITASAGGVRHDRLSVPVSELRRLASDVWSELSDNTAPLEATIPDELVAQLRALALQLLPPEVSDTEDNSHRQLLISTDGFLAALPFETLNLAADGTYRPLLADWDVAYVRREASLFPSGSGSTELLVADPALTESTRRKLSVEQPLPMASKEAEEISSYLDNPIVLEGVDATKQKLYESWDHASLLYVAAHFLANPEVPYLTMLPLHNPDPHAAPDAAMLDAGDVRAARLDGCELVVLSGCATGTPSTVGRLTGPGFGDVFLDSGARAVVQTFWAVRDDQAHRQMSAFVLGWREAGRSPVAALCDVRREEMRGTKGIRHPYHWAAFSIELGRL